LISIALAKPGINAAKKRRGMDFAMLAFMETSLQLFAHPGEPRFLVGISPMNSGPAKE
jgi:hypothetical protein